MNVAKFILLEITWKHKTHTRRRTQFLIVDCNLHYFVVYSSIIKYHCNDLWRLYTVCERIYRWRSHTRRYLHIISTREKKIRGKIKVNMHKTIAYVLHSIAPVPGSRTINHWRLHTNTLDFVHSISFHWFCMSTFIQREGER